MVMQRRTLLESDPYLPSVGSGGGDPEPPPPPEPFQPAALRREEPVEVRFYQPLTGAGEPAPVDAIDLSRTLTTLSFSTGLGGFTGMSLGYAVETQRGRVLGYLPRHVKADGFQHCEVLIGEKLVWEGLVTAREFVGDEVRTVECAGYGVEYLNGDVYLNPSDALTATSGALLLDALRTLRPLVTPRDFTDPRVLHKPSDFYGMTIGQMFNKACVEGGEAAPGLNRLWDFFVYEGRNLRFAPRLEPSQPEYVLPIDSRSSRRETFSDAYGAVLAAFTVEGEPQETQQFNSASFSRRFPNVTRRAYQSGNEDSPGGAAQTALTWLDEHDDAGVSARVSCPDSDGFTTPFGARVPGYLVRAGQWVQLGEEAPLMILTTQYDVLSRQLAATLGRAAQTQQQLILRLREESAARRKNLNPFTGQLLRKRPPGVFKHFPY